jgi:hypothetical protein
MLPVLLSEVEVVDVDMSVDASLDMVSVEGSTVESVDGSTVESVDGSVAVTGSLDESVAESVVWFVVLVIWLVSLPTSDSVAEFESVCEPPSVGAVLVVGGSPVDESVDSEVGIDIVTMVEFVAVPAPPSSPHAACRTKEEARIVTKLRIALTPNRPPLYPRRRPRSRAPSAASPTRTACDAPCAPQAARARGRAGHRTVSRRRRRSSRPPGRRS